MLIQNSKLPLLVGGKRKWLTAFVIYFILNQVFCLVVDKDLGLTREMDVHANNRPSIVRAIDMQMNMESFIAKTFDKLFLNFTKEADAYTKRVIYTCDKKCTGENAHEYGLTSAFLVSVLSERKFAIKSTNEYSLYDFYEERNYTWKLDIRDVINRKGQMILPPSTNRKRALVDLHLLEGELQQMDFDRTFKQDFVTISGNYNWVQDLRRHYRSIKTMPWLFKAHACDVNRLVHFGLFRVPHYVRDTINAQLLEKLGDKRLICFHGNKNAFIKTNEILDFISLKYHYSGGYKIYISNTDSKAFFDTKFDLENNFNKAVIHFNVEEIYKHVKQKEQTRENFRNFRNNVDVYILMMCDVLVTMESPIGILAAHLRRNSDGLFCYRNGIIFPCTRELIAGSFRDIQHIPSPLDRIYLTANMKKRL